MLKRYIWMVRTVLTTKQLNIIPVRDMCGALTKRKDTQNTILFIKMVQSVKNTDIEGVNPLINSLLFFLFFFPRVEFPLLVPIRVEEGEVVSVVFVRYSHDEMGDDEQDR